jgi:glucose/arabinose dehydrogenase
MKKNSLPGLLAARLGFIGAALSLCALAEAQTIPTRFAITTIANVSNPTAMAFTPDGRLLIATQGGALRVVKNGTLLPTPSLTLNSAATGAEPKVCTPSERGLLGVAVDPDFVTNKYVYLFYTARNGSTCQQGGAFYGTATNYNATGLPVNRVSRFVLGDDDLITVSASNPEFKVVDNMPSRGGNHNAGDIHFGKDGYLYISIGDGGTDYAGSGGGGSNDAARDKHVLTGKILRVTRDGAVPPGNPFTGANTGTCAVSGATTAGNHCQETFAWGLRNPFRFAMDPNATGTRFYINDVGQGVWEEVNESLSGADYGWNICEGRHDSGTTSAGCNTSAISPTPTLPVYEYAHGIGGVPGTTLGGCNSITGGAFVPNGLWPGYNGRYLIADVVCSGIWSIPTDGTPTAPVLAGQEFATAMGQPTAVVFGPFGAGKALYVAAYNGTVKAIHYKSAALDIDGNGVPEAATDGLLILRYLLGYRGAALTADATGAGATRSTSQIEMYLAAKTASGTSAFKVSAGGSSVHATSDGLLMLRHLLGLTGTALTNGVPLTASLPGAPELNAYLSTLTPE